MRRLWLLAVVCLWAALVRADQRIYGNCQQGNTQANVQGLLSTNTLMGSFPSCTVTVFNTGTQNLTTIYSDNNRTAKANAFTAASDGSWFFYIPSGTRVDIQLSGGGLASPITLGDILAVDLTASPVITTPTITSPVITGNISGGATATFGNLTTEKITATGDMSITGNAAFSGPGPWVDITAFGCKGDGTLNASTGTDNSSCLSTAFAAAIAANATVYIPCGIFTVKTPQLTTGNTAAIAWLGTRPPRILGESMVCSILQYSGTTAVQSLLLNALANPASALADPGGFNNSADISNITLWGNTHVQDGIDFLECAMAHLKRVSVYSVVNTAFYTKGCTQVDFVMPVTGISLAIQIYGVTPSVRSTNALVLDSYDPVSSPTSQMQINTPILMSTSGIGLWMKNGTQNIKVINAQLAANPTNLQIDQGALQINIDTSLIEQVAPTYNGNLVVNGSNVIFNTNIISSAAVNIGTNVVGTGSGVQFHGDEMAGFGSAQTVTIGAGAVVPPVFDGVFNGFTLTDNSQGAIIRGTESLSTGYAVSDFPWQLDVIPPRSSNGAILVTVSPVYASGNWTASGGTSVTLFTNSTVSNVLLSTWVAHLCGSFVTSTAGFDTTIPRCTELTQGTNIITGTTGQTLTFSIVGSSFKMAVSAGAAAYGFMGRVEFIPNGGSGVKYVGTATAGNITATSTVKGATIQAGSASNSTLTQVERGTATGCATAASAGAVCTTVVTWTNTFADNGYTPACQGRGITSGVPAMGGVTATASGSVTVQTVAVTAAAAQFGSIDCTGLHP